MHSRNESSFSKQELDAKKQKWVEQMKESPIALVPEKANEQHYEVPPSFFEEALGSNLKYSSGYWPSSETTLDQSEVSMLELSCERAELKDGQNILELGCGWGSLTCFMASQYPNSQITAVSNSKDQKEHILKRCEDSGLANVNVITADMNEFSTDQSFDRVISIEMFEHMRNYKNLLKRLSNLMVEDGKLFVHVFCHKQSAYLYEIKNERDWMTKYFFTGGIMPSKDIFNFFDEDLMVVNSWEINGKHYSQTSKAWLKNMDKDSKIIKLFSKLLPKTLAFITLNSENLLSFSTYVLFALTPAPNVTLPPTNKIFFFFLNP